jgi:hypothetical protein
MGTNNFHCVNASRIYPVLMNYETCVYDEEGNETDETEYIAPDVYEVDDFISAIKETAKNLAKNLGIEYTDGCDEDPNLLRSYPSTQLFQLYQINDKYNSGVVVNINCVLRQGYYEGACLDWYISYECDGYIGEDMDDVFFRGLYAKYNNNGMIKIHFKNFTKYAIKAEEELINVVELLFQQFSENE